MPVNECTEDGDYVSRSDGVVLPLSQQRPLAQAARTTSRPKGLTTGTWVWALLTVALAAWLFHPDSWTTLFFTALVLLLLVTSVYLVFKYLPDNELTPSFLTMQLVIGSFPLTIPMQLLHNFVPGIIIAIFVAPGVEKLAPDREFHSLDHDSKFEAILQAMRESPAWKRILMLILLSFVSHATVVEAFKWMLARRYRGFILHRALTRAHGARHRKIGVRGILASSCMVAIGYATLRSLVFERIERGDFSVGIFMRIWRIVLFFCIEIGSLFYIALADASRTILQDRTNPESAFLIAVLIHGTFELLHNQDPTANAFHKVPEVWLDSSIPAVEIILVLALILLCRSRYRNIRTKERRIMG